MGLHGDGALPAAASPQVRGLFALGRGHREITLDLDETLPTHLGLHILHLHSYRKFIDASLRALRPMRFEEHDCE